MLPICLLAVIVCQNLAEKRHNVTASLTICIDIDMQRGTPFSNNFFANSLWYVCMYLFLTSIQ